MSEEKEIRQISYREMQVFQTDDGRRVEVYTTQGTVDFSMPDAASNPEDLNLDHLDNQEILYIGVLHLHSPHGGTREIKFTIPNVNGIEEALSQYYVNADKAIEEIKQRSQMDQEAQDSQILQVPAEALDQLNEMDPDGSGNILIP